MMGYGYGAGGWSCPGAGAGGYGYGHWGLAVMGIFWLIVIVGVIALIVWAARRPWHHAAATGPAGGGRAVEIARERYARGEITGDEFKRLTDDLR